MRQYEHICLCTNDYFIIETLSRIGYEGVKPLNDVTTDRKFFKRNLIMIWQQGLY